MDLIEAIDTASSAGRLERARPDPEHLELILKAAERAPDHGRLKPWRLIVLEGAAGSASPRPRRRPSAGATPH